MFCGVNSALSSNQLYETPEVRSTKRVGLYDISLIGNQARLAPIELKVSETMRLKRIARDAIYKEDQRQIVVPLKPARGGSGKQVNAAAQLVALLRELVPPPVPEAVGAGSAH